MKWLDNYGKEENPNDSKISSLTPIETIGTTNKGRNYSPAWGGQFYSGGGLKRSEDYGSKSKPYPSVNKKDFAGGGRSYPIPTRADAVDALKLAGLHGRSDVKQKVYAKYPELKKQNGGNINYYKAGLDFEPKSISQNGYDYKSLGEGALATASFIPGPVGYGASVIGSGIDAYDAYNAYQRGDTGEALTEAGQAALGLIPFGSYLKPLTKGMEFTSKANKMRNLVKGAQALNKVADISDIISSTKKKQSGAIITDEMGQWRHPGEITKIPSNRITMKGVNYNVLGVSDTGDKKLMKPGGEYKFKGKSVTEYPNFTNKQSNWLDEL